MQWPAEPQEYRRGNVFLHSSGVYKFGMYQTLNFQSEENLSQCHFARHKSHPGSNPWFRSERPPTNRLSHGIVADDKINRNYITYSIRTAQ
jgi:hypothetical protein